VDRSKLAKAYDREVKPRWDDLFVPFLLELFPESLPAKCKLLEIGCTTGRLTGEILDRMSPSDRLIAVEDIRELMDLARKKVADDDRKRVFFKKEHPAELSFTDGAFDGILSGGLSPEYDLAGVIAASARMLRRDGFLILGAPLMGSFQELLDIFREVLEKEDLIAAQEGLDRFVKRLPDRMTANRMLTRAGLVECRVQVQEQTVQFGCGIDMVKSPLTRQHCLDECLGLVRDRGWREGVLAGMIRTLDTYFPEGIEMTLVMGRLSATRV
jgi:SAM-dependent methyltransferase